MVLKYPVKVIKSGLGEIREGYFCADINKRNEMGTKLSEEKDIFVIFSGHWRG